MHLRIETKRLGFEIGRPTPPPEPAKDDDDEANWPEYYRHRRSAPSANKLADQFWRRRAAWARLAEEESP